MAYDWSAKTLIYTLCIGLFVFLLHFGVLATGIETSFTNDADFGNFGIQRNVTYADGPRTTEFGQFISEYDLRLRVFAFDEDTCTEFDGTWVAESTPWYWFNTPARCDGYLELELLTGGLIDDATADNLMLGGRSISQSNWENLLVQNNVPSGTLPQTPNVCQMPYTQSRQIAQTFGCTWYTGNIGIGGDGASIQQGFSMWSLVWSTTKIMFNFNVEYGVGQPWDMFLSIFNSLVLLAFVLAIIGLLIHVLSLIPFVGGR